jgi:hypothetical protein
MIVFAVECKWVWRIFMGIQIYMEQNRSLHICKSRCVCERAYAYIFVLRPLHTKSQFPTTIFQDQVGS